MTVSGPANASPSWPPSALRLGLVPAVAGTLLLATILARPTFWQEGLYLIGEDESEQRLPSDRPITIGPGRSSPRLSPSRPTIRIGQRIGDRDGSSALPAFPEPSSGAASPSQERPAPPQLQRPSGFQPATPTTPLDTGAAPVAAPSSPAPPRPLETPPPSLREALTALLLPPAPVPPVAIAPPVTAPVPQLSTRATEPLPRLPAAPLDLPEVGVQIPVPEAGAPALTPMPEVAPSGDTVAVETPTEVPPEISTDVPEPEVVRLPELIAVDQFEVVGSTVFEAADLAAIALSTVLDPEAADRCNIQGPTTAPETLRLTPSQLVQASSAIEQCYLDNQYINSGAFIAESELREAEDGTVKITVLEGSLEAINVELTRAGLFGLNPGYISTRLDAGIGSPFNLNELVESVRLLELDPLINKITTELVPGTQAGSSILDVQVEQDDGLDVVLFTDNDRSPSVGSIRRGLTISQANLLGLGDRLSLGYNYTGGSDEFSAGYTVPINPRNGTIGFTFSTTNSEVIEEPFTVLDIESKTRNYELFYRQPVILTPSQELALSLRLTRRDSQAEFLEGINGEPIPFPGTGADAEGRTRVTAIRFGQEWITRSAQQVIALLSEFSFGLGGFGSTIQPIPPDGRFFLWRGQGQWVRSLGPPETLFILRGNVQLADRPLLPSEQFSFGGQRAGRGYRLNTLLRDNGWFLSSEFRLPLFRLPRKQVLTQVAPFFDVGGGWNRGDFPETQFLTSTGVGVIFDIGDDFSARLDWGIPLSDFDSTGSSLQDSGLHFSIRFTP